MIIENLFLYTFFRHALLASLMASVICGIVGTLVVEKRMVMLAGGVAHTAYGGVGLGYLFGFEPLLGALGFSLVCALGVGKARRSHKVHSDVIIALFWSLGMALGVAFTSLMDSYPPDMASYLFGNILSVSGFDLWMMFSIMLFSLFVIVPFFNYWKIYLFDEQFAKLQGLPVALMEYLLLALISCAVVILIRVAGIMLVLALLSAPAACASLFTRRLKTRIVAAMLFSVLFSFTGIVLSFLFDISSGAMIVIVATVSCFVLRVLKR